MRCDARQRLVGSSSLNRRSAGTHSRPQAKGHCRQRGRTVAYRRAQDEVFGLADSLPSYATVTPTGQLSYTWTTTSTDTRGLQVPGSNNRLAAAWYANMSFTVALNLTDGQAHNLELYVFDWDNRSRTEQVQISSTSGTVLDTEKLSSFSGGEYVDWTISGNVVITITNTGGLNALINGLFLDGTVGTSSIPELATATRLGGAESIRASGSASAGDHSTRISGVDNVVSGGEIGNLAKNAAASRVDAVLRTLPDDVDWAATTAEMPIDILARRASLKRRTSAANDSTPANLRRLAPYQRAPRTATLQKRARGCVRQENGSSGERIRASEATIYRQRTIGTPRTRRANPNGRGLASRVIDCMILCCCANCCRLQA